MLPPDASARQAALLQQIDDLQAERDRLAAALDLAERDRELLGYEVHDGIVQDLTAAAMLLESAGAAATFAKGEDRAHYGGGMRLLREAVAEARRLISGLESVDYGKQGLVTALSRLVEKFRTQHELPVTLATQGEEIALPAGAQHLLLRIVHEALYNVWKHAAASRVEVGLERSGRELRLTVSDDGRGFDPQRVISGHFGLDGMHARAHVLGGDLRIDSLPGRGTRVTIAIQTPPEA
jgi:signal transduction histidine kinase